MTHNDDMIDWLEDYLNTHFSDVTVDTTVSDDELIQWLEDYINSIM